MSLNLLKSSLSTIGTFIKFNNLQRHDLGRELCWGEFSLCERTGSKMEDTPKIFSNTLKVQKTLRDMHRNLIEAISAEGGGTLSNPVIQASTKLLMPGFLSSYLFYTCNSYYLRWRWILCICEFS